jgi:hypothetical protein
VFLGRLITSNGPKLLEDLRAALCPRVVIFGPDAFLQVAPIVEGTGAAAEGFAAEFIGRFGMNRAASRCTLRRRPTGLLDAFSIDRYADTTKTTIGVYRIESGRLKFVMPIDPPSEILSRR